LAYKISRGLKLEDVIDFRIYEQQVGHLFLSTIRDRILPIQEPYGGTWVANRYPGLTCDVPTHIYTLPWTPKYDWTSFMASGEEIRRYVIETAKKCDLDRFVQFKTAVKDCVWR
jgi:hypothetical protein